MKTATSTARMRDAGGDISIWLALRSSLLEPFMRSSSTRRACGSRQACGKRQECVSHKVFGRAQNARPHAPQAVHVSLTEDKTKTPEGSTCVRGDVVRYCEPSPESGFQTFLSGRISTFGDTQRKRDDVDKHHNTQATRAAGAISSTTSTFTRNTALPASRRRERPLGQWHAGQSTRSTRWIGQAALGWTTLK